MFFETQYNMVTSSRKILLEYCKSLSNEHFVTESTSFGRGSIRNLLVHIGTTYEFWIGQHGLGKSMTFRSYSSVKDVAETEAFYETIDLLMEEFLRGCMGSPDREMELTLDTQQTLVTPLMLFTHVITHEFHHKGQILSLSRHLGYIPVDTDIIR